MRLRAGEVRDFGSVALSLEDEGAQVLRSLVEPVARVDSGVFVNRATREGRSLLEALAEEAGGHAPTKHGPTRSVRPS